MRIITQSFRRSFEIVKREMPIAKLNFLRWYSFKAEAHTPVGKLCFLPENFWKSRFRIERNGKKIGEIKFTWKTRARLSMRWPGEAISTSYYLRRRGIFKPYYELTNDLEQIIATLKMKVNWRQFSSETTVEYQQSVPEEHQVELLLCLGYIISVMRSRQSSG